MSTVYPEFSISRSAAIKLLEVLGNVAAIHGKEEEITPQEAKEIPSLLDHYILGVPLQRESKRVTEVEALKAYLNILNSDELTKLFAFLKCVSPAQDQRWGTSKANRKCTGDHCLPHGEQKVYLYAEAVNQKHFFTGGMYCYSSDGLVENCIIYSPSEMEALCPVHHFSPREGRQGSRLALAHF